MIDMKKLYIIGNGFDLHHGLKTSYHDFGNYVKENDSELLYYLETYFDYPDTDALWSNFEQNLAKLNLDQVISDNEDSLPNYSSDDFRDRDRYTFPDNMDNIVEKLTDGLINTFKEFILGVTLPNCAFRENKLFIEKEAYFFTFNYTDMLEKIYNINSENILYIHNSVYHRYDNIVLGHGRDPETFKEKTLEHPHDLVDPDEIAEWYDKNDKGYDYSLDTGAENIMKYFEKSFKPTQDIIEQNGHFFEKLHNIENVYVLGHSLSNVDMPYISKIKDSVTLNANWTVSYYEQNDKQRFAEILIGMGIKPENINLILIENLSMDKFQLKFPFK